MGRWNRNMGRCEKNTVTDEKNKGRWHENVGRGGKNTGRWEKNGLLRRFDKGR